jgi:hypothetical protein
MSMMNVRMTIPALPLYKTEHAHRAVSRSPAGRYRVQRLLTRTPGGAWRLDREIVAGLAIDESAARAVRARQLTSRSMRLALVRLYANVLDAAEERSADPVSPLIIEHAAVVAARQAISLLIARLNSGEALEPRGLALARLLVYDDAGPIFRAGSKSLTVALAEIASAS